MRNQPAGWSYWIHDCDRVIFDRCRILADVRYPNNDGIHINCSRDVTVSNCIIETGDDSIVIRANSRSLREDRACERVTVTNCILRSWSSAIRLGWTNDGVMRDCVFSNLVIYDSSKGISAHLPEYKFKNPDDASNDYGREDTLIENMTFSNIQMDKVYYPFHFLIPDSEEVRCKAIRNLDFSNIRSESLFMPFFQGRAGCPIENIRFDNCSFVRLTEKELPDAVRHGAIPKKMVENFIHVKGIRFNNTELTFTGDFTFKNDYDWTVADR